MDDIIKSVLKRKKIADEKSTHPRRIKKKDNSIEHPIAAHIHTLQRSAGNAAVQNMIRTGVIQTKLKISAPDDEYEKESEVDVAADAVMRMPTLSSANIQNTASITPSDYGLDCVDSHQAEGKRLQRSSAPLIQAKLTISQPNDRYKQEADRTIQQILNTETPSNAVGLGQLAVTRDGTTILSPSVLHHPLLDQVLAHEAVHRAQFQSLGRKPTGTQNQLEAEARSGGSLIQRGQAFSPKYAAAKRMSLYFNQSASTESPRRFSPEVLGEMRTHSDHIKRLLEEGPNPTDQLLILSFLEHWKAMDAAESESSGKSSTYYLDEFLRLLKQRTYQRGRLAFFEETIRLYDGLFHDIEGSAQQRLRKILETSSKPESATELTPLYQGGPIIDIDRTIGSIENWQKITVESTADASLVEQSESYKAFVLLDVYKRMVQLGDIMFGVKKLQGAADILADSETSTYEKWKAGLWAAFIVGLDLMMIGGIAAKVTQGLSTLAGKLGLPTAARWIGALISSLVQKAIGFAESHIPKLVASLTGTGTWIKTGLVALIESAKNSRILQTLMDLKEPIPLPRAIEVLSDDVILLVRRWMGAKVPDFAIKAGIGTQLLADSRAALEARRIHGLHEADMLLGLKNQPKGVIGETLQGLVYRLRGMKIAPADLSKLRGNQGIDMLLFNPKTLATGVAEAKATSQPLSTFGLLSNRPLRAADPLASELGLPLGIRVCQASRGFNVSRLMKLARHSNPEKRQVAELFLQRLESMMDGLSVTRLRSGEVQVFELTMSPDLLQIAHMEEVLTMTFGEIKQAYYFLVAAETGSFVVKAGMAAED